MDVTSREPLRTPRLRLVPATPDLVQAELRGTEALAERLGVASPSSWPPEYYDAAATRHTLDQLVQPGMAGWWSYYLLADEALVGIAGYKGPPDGSGAVELGYSLLPAHQRLGYATEAVHALVDHALRFPVVTRVIAETLPALAPSIGVLERNGFRLIGEGSERGVIRFELTREDVVEGHRHTPIHLRALIRLLGHLVWADRRVLAALEVDAANQPAHELLGHILGAERVWLARVQGTVANVVVWPHLTLAEARALAAANASAFRALILGLSPADLRRTVSYTTSAGEGCSHRSRTFCCTVSSTAHIIAGRLLSSSVGWAASPPAPTTSPSPAARPPPLVPRENFHERPAHLPRTPDCGVHHHRPRPGQGMV